jgi:hypothetical protein
MQRRKFLPCNRLEYTRGRKRDFYRFSLKKFEKPLDKLSQGVYSIVARLSKAIAPSQLLEKVRGKYGQYYSQENIKIFLTFFGFSLDIHISQCNNVIVQRGDTEERQEQWE